MKKVFFLGLVWLFFIAAMIINAHAAEVLPKISFSEAESKNILRSTLSTLRADNPWVARSARAYITNSSSYEHKLLVIEVFEDVIPKQEICNTRSSDERLSKFRMFFSFYMKKVKPSDYLGDKDVYVLESTASDEQFYSPRDGALSVDFISESNGIETSHSFENQGEVSISLKDKVYVDQEAKKATLSGAVFIRLALVDPIQTTSKELKATFIGNIKAQFCELME